MSAHLTVWIIDDDPSIRWVLEKALAAENFDTQSFTSGRHALAAIKNAEKQQTLPAAIISDVRMPGINGLDLLKIIHQTHPELPIIIMTAHSDLDSAVASYQAGAFDYLAKPFDIDDATLLIKRGVEHRQQQEVALPVSPPPPMTDIIGEAPAMQDVFRAIGRLSQSNMTVLINGESGTGKELVAKALHRHSPQAQAPFIALNMAAIPKELVESELFGHEKGAYTGANSLRKGYFEQACDGTLFLDEIGDMPPDSQTRLLRVLAEGEFYRVGGHTPVNSTTRIIAATHQNLEQKVIEGAFREDLYHRLNVIKIHLPRLQERKEDIPRLARFFLDKAARELNVIAKILSPEVEQAICQMPWPGNVRQLENTCRWLTVMAAGQEIFISDLPLELMSSNASEPRKQKSWLNGLQEHAAQMLAAKQSNILADILPDFERTLIKTALQHSGGRKKEAACLLGWGRNTLTRKLKELSMEL